MNGRLNPSRLDLARRLRGFTKRALSQAAAISERSLAGYFDKDREPNSQVVSRFAEVLDVPPQFFYAPTLEEPPREWASFRALSKVSKKKREQALASGALGLGLSDWIENDFTLPNCDIPRYENTDPEIASVELRSYWGLGERPIPNMVNLLEAHGARVFALVDESGMIDAYSFWREGVPYIFLNTMKSAERSRMDVAHELGHLVLHTNDGGACKNQTEREANQFASAFLMPRGSVLGAARRGASLRQVMSDKRFWIVSVANLTYRMHEVALLNEYEYRQRFREIGRRNYRTMEPNPAPRETSQLLHKVFTMLREDGVGLGHVANELAVYSHDLSGLVFNLVVPPAPTPLPNISYGESHHDLSPSDGSHSAGHPSLETPERRQAGPFSVTTIAPRRLSRGFQDCSELRPACGAIALFPSAGLCF